MPGGGRSVLARSGDSLYVVKCPHNLQGPNVLANELLGSELMSLLSLPNPPWRFAYFGEETKCLSHSSIGQSGLSCRGKLHFASKCLEPIAPNRLYGFLPQSFIHRVLNRSDFLGALVFDIWAGSTDARQAVYAEDHIRRTFEAVFIDHGHDMGGPHWSWNGKPGSSLCLDRTMYAGLIDPVETQIWATRIEAILPSKLPQIVAGVPPEWHTGDINRLQNFLLARADCIQAILFEELLAIDAQLNRASRVKIGSPSISSHGILLRRNDGDGSSTKVYS
jgi:hypothetical protein